MLAVDLHRDAVAEIVRLELRVAVFFKLVQQDGSVTFTSVAPHQRQYPLRATDPLTVGPISRRGVPAAAACRAAASRTGDRWAPSGSVDATRREGRDSLLPHGA